MPDFLNHGQMPAIFSLAVVAVMFVLFVRETYPTEVVALGGVAVLLASGVLPVVELQFAFSNPAPLTIAAMFILTGALVRTGALNVLTGLVAQNASKRPKTVLLALAGFTLLASAFMNNTPVVVMMIPVVVALAKQMGMSASKLLIPLSYTAILGGMLTLIGTSTNLLVDGIASSEGLEPFDLFEVTPLAIILVVFGMLYMRFIGASLLPDRASMAEMLGRRKQMKFFTEVAIPEDSPLIGELVGDVGLFRRQGMRLIDVLRGDESLRRGFPNVELRTGDRVVLRTGVDELLGLKADKSVELVEQLSKRKTTTVEALISPGCRLVGNSLGALRLRRRYGVYPLAVHRHSRNIGRQLDDIVVRVGDTLLLEGAPEDIERLARDEGLVDIATPAARPFRRRHAPIVLVVLAGVVLLSAFGLASIFALAVVGVALVLLTRCIDAEEAFGFVDGRLLVLIYSMLAVGAALQGSGAVEMLSLAVAPYLANLPAPLLVWGIYLLTSILTEMISNNAVAVVVTPVAIGLAEALGIDARPLVVAVMVAASASFATPIGYQTNTLVYGAGGYKFTDFLKIGVPLNLAIGILASVLIPVIWPL